jgi:hypothetical protein
VESLSEVISTMYRRDQANLEGKSPILAQTPGQQASGAPPASRRAACPELD